MTDHPTDTELEALARAATPGWRRAGNVETYHVFVQHDTGIAPVLGRVLCRLNEHFEHKADAAFIAACTPEVVLGLLARIDVAERAVEITRAQTSEYKKAADVAYDERDGLRIKAGGLALEVERLAERITTIADESSGPHPVQSADESLTCIERTLFEWRKRCSELERARESAYQRGVEDGKAAERAAVVRRMKHLEKRGVWTHSSSVEHGDHVKETSDG